MTFCSLIFTLLVEQALDVARALDVDSVDKNSFNVRFFDRLMKHLKATYDCEGFGFYTSQTKILTKVNELVIVARREHPHDLVGFYMITPATKDSGPNLHLIESFTKHLGYGQMMLSYIMQNMYIKEGPLVVSDLLYSAFPFWKAAKLRWRDRITFSDKLHRELIDTYCKLQDSD